MKEIYEKVIKHERYLKNIKYGEPRRGHAEGSVENHIKELEENLEKLREDDPFVEQFYWKLKVLIHVHDSFKAESARNAPILDPNSHASLARAFLAQYTEDTDMLNIAQYHDIGYAVFRNFKDKGHFNYKRLDAALESIHNHNLFLLFCIIDSCTVSKGREMITWLVKYVAHNYPYVLVDESYILEGGSAAAF